jgi:hypothetical protein
MHHPSSRFLEILDRSPIVITKKLLIRVPVDRPVDQLPATC